jgi:ankyrin repeat protein
MTDEALIFERRLTPGKILWRDRSTSAGLLHLAAAHGRSRLCRTLMGAGADVNIRDHNDWTPLHHAARAKPEAYNAVLSLLLSDRLDINARDNLGRTALFSAVHCQNLRVAKLLLERGADPTIPTADGKTTVMHQIFWTRKQKKALELAKLFAAKGCVPCAPDKRGRTPLHHAAMNLHRDDAIKFLASSGCKMKDRDIHGKTALHYVVQGRKSASRASAILALLTCSGGDMTAHKDLHKRTPLDYATGAALKMLVKKKRLKLRNLPADARARLDEWNAACAARTAKYLAAHSESTAIPDSGNESGNSVLAESAESGNVAPPPGQQA